MAVSLRILTNAVGRCSSPTWRRVSEYFETPAGNRFQSLVSAIKLYRAAGRKDYECVVLGSNRPDSWYALLKAALPFDRPPTVKLQCEWYEPSNRLARFAKRVQLRMVGASLDACAVWASREIDAYSEAFGIPKSTFHFVAYHHTLNSIDVEPTRGDYVFSGGNRGRDYGPLIEAAKGLSVPVELAITRPSLLEGLEVPENVNVRGYSHLDYVRKMAGCLINVVTVDSTVLHSTGQQTFLNSMALGKPTIVTDPDGARDYIRHGHNGLLVRGGDPAALRDAIHSLVEDPEYACRLGREARRTAERYSTDAHFQRVCELVRKMLRARRRAPGE